MHRSAVDIVVEPTLGSGEGRRHSLYTSRTTQLRPRRGLSRRQTVASSSPKPQLAVAAGPDGELRVRQDTERVGDQHRDCPSGHLQEEAPLAPAAITAMLAPGSGHNQQDQPRQTNRHPAEDRPQNRFVQFLSNSFCKSIRTQ